MAGTVSSSKRRKSSKKKTDKKKKYKVKDSKKRRHDSISSFSDDDSYNSEYSSSGYRRKSKKSKKRSRRDYSVSPYSDDEARDNVRKSRKTSKSSSKRDRKRYSSSDSHGDAQRVKKTKRKRLTGDDVGKSKKRKRSSTKKSKKRVRSSSPDSLSCSTCPDKSSSSIDGKNQKTRPILEEQDIAMGGDETFSDGQSDGALIPVNNSRRLRSVIAAAYQPEEDDRWDNNSSKEEIVNELDGYPSPISLDSSEGINERDSVNHFHGISSNEIRAEDVAGDHQPGGARTSTFKEGKDTDESVLGLAGGDLESILRQKALENLKKFKVERQTAPQIMSNIKTSNKNDALNKSTIKDPDTQVTNQRSGLSLEPDFSCTDVIKHPESGQVEMGPGLSKQTVSPPTYSFPGHVEENLVTSSSSVSKVHDIRAADLTNSSIMEPVSSSPRPNSGNQTSGHEDEAKDGPEFEQKTMSVMRGGEMVQVTYKVKIPKRAAALARRQLRR